MSYIIIISIHIESYRLYMYHPSTYTNQNLLVVVENKQHVQCTHIHTRTYIIYTILYYITSVDTASHKSEAKDAEMN